MLQSICRTVVLCCSSHYPAQNYNKARILIKICYVYWRSSSVKVLYKVTQLIAKPSNYKRKKNRKTTNMPDKQLKVVPTCTYHSKSPYTNVRLVPFRVQTQTFAWTQKQNLEVIKTQSRCFFDYMTSKLIRTTKII